MCGRNKVCPEVRETARMSEIERDKECACVTIVFDLLMAFVLSDSFIADSSTTGSSFEIFLS